MSFKQTREQDEAWQCVEDPETGTYFIERMQIIVHTLPDTTPVFEHIFRNNLEAAGYVLQAAGLGDLRAIDALGDVCPQAPSIAASLIVSIERQTVDVIKLRFDKSRDASQVEVELCALKDRLT
jgi:hypothetical protein